MHNYEEELQVASRIAISAGEIMLKYFDGDQGIEIKADHSQVTVADKLINSMVISELSAAFPDDGIIGEEESTSEYGSGRKWFCDPIDGTAAYIWGLPSAMFSLALIVDGTPVLGVAYDPFLDRIYTGIVGTQSLCNGKPLQVSQLDLSTGIFAISSSAYALIKSKLVQQLIARRVRLASFSGAVYKSCLVARGRFTGYVEPGVHAHDVAAIHPIVLGAGGKVTGMDGKELDYTKPFRGAIVTNGVVHEEIVKFCE